MLISLRAEPGLSMLYRAEGRRLSASLTSWPEADLARGVEVKTHPVLSVH